LLEDDYAACGLLVYNRIKVHRIFHASGGVIDELAISSSEVEDGSCAGDPLAKKRRQHFPDLGPVFSLPGEAGPINSLQFRLVWRR
jgi:hypothetical protein